MKFNIFSLFLFGILLSRDNPFQPPAAPNVDDKNSKTEQNSFENFDFKLPSTARVLRDIKITYENVDGSISEESFNINKQIDWHYPISINQKDAKITKNTDYASVNKIIFFAKDNDLYITTKRKILRDFVLPEPFRIIIDFDKDAKDVEREINLDQKFFAKIDLISHREFYRAQITLDGNYEYEIKKSEDGFLLILK
ncbi:MAG: AMIN domain-containing protein [Helicobacter sp.]|nr:AMIN domain-containing protein [Helicobacter sp.]